MAVFLTKSLYRDEAKNFHWRFNLPVLTKSAEIYKSPLVDDVVISTPSLFIRGGDSNYVQEKDFGAIKKYLPNSKIITIIGAQHWLHATHLQDTADNIVDFLQ